MILVQIFGCKILVLLHVPGSSGDQNANGKANSKNYAHEVSGGNEVFTGNWKRGNSCTF